MTRTEPVQSEAKPAPPPPAARTILHVAWLAILLGVGVQVALLAVARLPGIPAFVVEASQKVSWSVIVCVGVAIGAAAAQVAPAAGGVAGLLAAPLAFVAAKTVHKSVGYAVGVAPASSPAGLIVVLAAVKAAQYAAFGYALSRLVRRGAGYRSFALAGLGAGAAGAAAVVGATLALAAAAPPAGVLTATAVNEVLFPLGCATVLFVATGFARANVAGASATV